jgi:hypothetical protein
MFGDIALPAIAIHAPRLILTRFISQLPAPGLDAGPSTKHHGLGIAVRLDLSLYFLTASANMLMLPSAVTGISSKYSTPFESSFPFAVDLSDIKFSLPSLNEQDAPEMGTQQPQADSPALLGLPRYAAQCPSAKGACET